MRDPFALAIAFGAAGSAILGPAVAYGLRAVPEAWRRRAEWALIILAALIAIAADLLPGDRLVYVLAVLPGLVTYLAFRTLVASTLVSLAPMYFAFGYLSRGRHAYRPEIALDRLWPLQPEWMLVYGSLYVFIAVLPLLVIRERELIIRTMKAYLTVMLIAYGGFLVYPTVAPRPEHVAIDSFSAWTLQIAYDVDAPHGCFPSLHVAYSFVAALACFRVHRAVGTAALLWASLIGLSTVFTKQHYVVDVPAGVLEALLAYVLFLAGHPRPSDTAADHRRAPARAFAAAGVYGVIVAGFWVAYRLGAQA